MISTILNVSYDVFKEASEILNVYYYDAPNGEIIMGSGPEGFVFSCKISESADITDFNTNIQPNAVEVFQEDDVVAKVVLESFQIKKYDIGTTTTYIGSASPNSLTSQAVWTIKKYTFDLVGNPVDQKVSKANVIWDNRVSITYY